MSLVEIRPSILEINSENIDTDLAAVSSLVKTLHLDIADGFFVERRTSLGADFVKKLKQKFPLQVEVHLMVNEPIKYIPAFIAAGADMITFHLEAIKNPKDVLDFIIKGGVKAGLALKIGSSVEFSQSYWDGLAEILLMSIHAGFGGQAFLAAVLPKITRLRSLGWDRSIEVDGGIKVGWAKKAVEAGADTLVAGTALFESGNIEEAYRKLVADSQI